MQLAGAKEWKLKPFTDAADETITLNSLDVLWIPQGWLHDGPAGPGDASVHLAIAVNPISLVDILSEITEKVSAQVRGAVLPPLPNRDQQALEAAIGKMGVLLRAALDGIDYQELSKALLMRTASGNRIPSRNVSTALGA